MATRRLPPATSAGCGDLGQAWASINGESVVTRVVFGDDDATVLLGAYTLEGLSLAADPVTQRVLPVEVHPT